MAFAIINHYIFTHPSGRKEPRKSMPHRNLVQASRSGNLVERSTGGACRFVAMEGVEVEPHLIG